jgi:hypothetical protein
MTAARFVLNIRVISHGQINTDLFSLTTALLPRGEIFAAISATRHNSLRL